MAMLVVALVANGALGSSVHARALSGANLAAQYDRIVGAPPWTAYTSLSVQKQTQFHFVLHLAGDLPNRPNRFGNALIEWTIAVDTNRNTAATGWPTANHSAGGPNPSEYLIELWWDGTQFGSDVANRTPLLVHSTEVLTPIAVQRADRTITYTVPPSALGNPTHFGFLAYFAVEHDPVVSLSPPNKVAPGPGSDRVFVGVLNAPFDPPACAYNDTLVLPSQNTHGGNCWARWSQSVDGHRLVVAPGAPAWATTTHSSVSESTKLNVEWTQAHAVPAHPSIVGAKSILWTEWLYGSNASANVTGWPFPTGFAFWNYTYGIVVGWDGSKFGAAVVNSTPTTWGGSPIVTQIPFKIVGDEVSVSISPSLVGNASLAGSDWLGVSSTEQTLTIDAHGNLVLQNGILNWELLTDPFCAPIGFDHCPPYS
ncbi:MAG: hypothetical protein L3K23_10200 [Thermoplasmata archaeon]|nr:hypothetical protein [Thermoplasmata archaeon]